MEIKQIFGQRLKDRRVASKKTQKELAAILSVEPNTVYKWESGLMLPSLETVFNLAKNLNTTNAYLLGETDDPARTGAISHTTVINKNGEIVKQETATHYVPNDPSPPNTKGESGDPPTPANEHSPPAETTDPADKVAGAFVIIRNIVRDKDELPEADKALLLNIMKYGVKALEDDPEAIEETEFGD